MIWLCYLCFAFIKITGDSKANRVESIVNGWIYGGRKLTAQRALNGKEHKSQYNGDVKVPHKQIWGVLAEKVVRTAFIAVGYEMYLLAILYFILCRCYDHY